MEQLRHARISSGLSQSELAHRLARRQQFVSKYEAGERRLDVVELVDIVAALGLELGDLLDRIRPQVASVHGHTHRSA